MKRFASERVAGLMERLGLDEDMAIESRLVSEDDRERPDARRGLQLRHPQARRRVRRRHQQAARDDLLGARQGPPQRGPDRDGPRLHRRGGRGGRRERPRRRRRRGVEPEARRGRQEDGHHRRRQIGGCALGTPEPRGDHGAPPELIESSWPADAENGEDWGTVERLVLLRTIDSLWVEHLTEMDDMRRGIGLRGYAQQDPLNEFRKEAFNLFEELSGFIRHGVASTIFRVTITHQPPPQPGGIRRSRPASPLGPLPFGAGNGPAAGTAQVVRRRRGPPGHPARRSSRAVQLPAAPVSIGPRTARRCAGGRCDRRDRGDQRWRQLGQRTGRRLHPERCPHRPQRPRWCGSWQQIQEVPRPLSG